MVSITIYKRTCLVQLQRHLSARYEIILPSEIPTS
jgi:hypothetical protein